jgi:hypothetical protein
MLGYYRVAQLLGFSVVLSFKELVTLIITFRIVFIGYKALCWAMTTLSVS